MKLKAIDYDSQISGNSSPRSSSPQSDQDGGIVEMKLYRKLDYINQF